MGCSHDERKISEINIEQLIYQKKTIIEEVSIHSKRPTEKVLRQMEIIDRQMRQELSNLKTKLDYFSREKETNEKSFYLKKKNEFVKLSLKWEKLFNSDKKNNDENISNSNSNSLDFDSFNENKSYDNSSESNNNVNIFGFEDSEEDDSSRYAKELCAESGSD